MISVSALAGVFVVSLVLVLTPGPNMMYLVSRSLTQGRRAGVISLAGVGVGFLAYLTATTLGVSAVFVAVPELYVAVKLAGAAYLAWLAITILRPGGASPFEPTTVSKDSPRRLFGMGLLTSLLNPKIAVMYLSLIPQFVQPRAGHVLLQGFVLGAVQVATSLTVDLLIVLAAGSVALFLARHPRWLRAQRYLTGTVLGAFAVKVATDTSRPTAA